MKSLLNRVLSDGIIPAAMNNANICLLPKDRTKLHDPSTFRPISLMNSALKIMDKWLKSRISGFMEQ
jgi:hypothetical protein